MATKRKNDATGESSPRAPVGGYVLESDAVAFNAGKPSIAIKVRNTGDRPIQVGSHFHFFETNKALQFDRAAAYGMHLDIPSSTAIRFEPGDERTVHLVPFGGKSRVLGFNNLVDAETGPHGAHHEPTKQSALDKARARGFKSM